MTVIIVLIRLLFDKLALSKHPDNYADCGFFDSRFYSLLLKPDVSCLAPVRLEPVLSQTARESHQSPALRAAYRKGAERNRCRRMFWLAGVFRWAESVGSSCRKSPRLSGVRTHVSSGGRGHAPVEEPLSASVYGQIRPPEP